MPKIVEIPGLGNVEFPDSMSDAQINSAIETDILPKIGQGSAPKGRGGVLPVFAESFATGITDIPGGIADLLGAIGAVEKPEETGAYKFSESARKTIQDVLGIDPNAEATTAETGAQALGSLASFLVPYLGAAKVAKALGAVGTGARIAGNIASGVQAGALGAEQQADQIRAQEAAGKAIAEGDKDASVLWGGAIGLTDLLPLERFLGPLEVVLAKVPLSKAGAVSKTVEGGIKRALTSATAEGAQESLSQLAQNLVEQGYYNPDLDVTEGLLGNAAAGGFAGGTFDAILQIMAGRKAGNLAKSRGQLKATLEKQAVEKRPEQVRAEASMGLDELRATAPVGNISIKRSVPTTGIPSYDVVDERGNVAARFSTPEAAVLAAEQYEKDSAGLTKFNRPSIAEMSGQVAAKPTKEQKAKGKKLAKDLKQAGALTPAPVQTPTTPEGQAQTVQSVAQVADQIGATPAQAAEIANPSPSAKPIMPKGRKRIAPVEAPVQGAVAAPAASTTAAEIPAPVTPVSRDMEFGTADERAAIRREIAPQAETFRDMTPEQQQAYAAELDRRYPGRTYSISPVETPAAPQAIPASQTPPVRPSEAPPAAVPPKKPTGAAAPFTTPITAAFKPITRTAEDMAKLADFNNRKEEITKQLNKKLSPITGNKTRVQLIDAVFGMDKAGRVAFAEGEAKGGDLIYLSYNLYDPKLTTEQLVDKLFDVMNHEVIHSLSNLGVFKPGEIKTLFNAAERIKYQGNKFSYYDRAEAMYRNVPDYTEEMIREEAVAEMFRDYRAGKLKLEGTPKGIVQRVIEFFRRIFTGFRDAKVGQIFKDIEAGKVGAREARPVEGGVRKLSAVPRDKNSAFRSVASSQRGLPESAMLDAQMALNEYPSGPAFGKSLESIGDLSHRMSENPENNLDRGLSIVDGKVSVGLRLLSNPVDIERINAIPELPELKAYADEHAKLPVYNEAQRAARDAAIAFGRKNWAAAESNLRTLKDMIDSGSYVETASSFDPQFEVGVRKFSVPAQLTGESEREFARWFKNGVAVNKDGTPKTVYHATDATKIYDQFDTQFSEMGTHFGSQSQAQSILTKGADDRFNAGIKFTPPMRVIPAYINLQNPVRLQDFGKWDPDNVLNQLVDGGIISPEEYDRIYEKTSSVTTKQVQSILSKKGYDGIVYLNRYEGTGADFLDVRSAPDEEFRAKYPNAEDSYIIFDPKQVKSAFNRFEPGTAKSRKFSIPAQLTGESEQEFKRWWKRSNAVDLNGNPLVYYNGRSRPLRNGQFNRGASGALPGEEGPYYFSPDAPFASDYATFNLSKGGDRKETKTGTMYPVFLSVQNPWDYQSSRNVDDVIDHVAGQISRGEVTLNEISNSLVNPVANLDLYRLGLFIERGDWEAIETPAVQRAIRDLGFDGFYLVEEGVRNLAVYKPEQIKSIFNLFEPGAAESRKLSVIPRAPEDWATEGEPDPGVDSQNQNGISPYRISQRIPRGKGREQEALLQDLEISLASMMLAEDAFNHNATNVLLSYGILPRIEGETPEQTARRFIRHFADNLLWLHDKIPADIRARSKLWYDGARKITTELAQQYNVPDTAIAAMIAAESPQKDWYQNVSLAERIADIAIRRRDFAFNDAMMETARKMKSLRPYMDLVNMMESGATIENMENFLRRRKGNMIAAGLMSEQELADAAKLAKAIFVRVYDETYNSRDYDIISPEGNKMGPATTKSGKRARVAWGSYKEIAKGISVLEDPSKENINIMLGNKHKVRNFFNNILSPNAGSDLTSDTHAVAAVHLKPLGGGAVEVHHNFGTSKKGHINAKNSGPFGVQGIYGLVADAYRVAAEERGILPREMQSITWEAIRGMYPPEMRRNRRVISLVNETWARYGKQELTLDEARNRLLEIANGIRPPSWARPDLGVPEDDGQAGDAPDVSGTQLRPGDKVGEPDSRAAVGSAKRTAEAIAVKAKSPNLSDSQLEDLAGQANEQVRKSVRKLSVIPQTIALSPALEEANSRIFAAKYVPSSPGEKLMAFLGGFSGKEGISKFADMFRVYGVQKGGQITKREREAYLSGTIDREESNFAEYSATAAQDMQARASHYTVEVGYHGAPTIMALNEKREKVKLSEGGDPNSAYMFVEQDQADSPFKVLEMIYDGGPNGESLVDQFRTYAVAQVSKKRIEQGKDVPSDITQEYIDAADKLGEQFPIIKDAFESYQRFNTKMIGAVRDVGYLTQELFEEFTDQQNYYSMYRQLEEVDVVPGVSGGLGSRIRFKAYEGSTTGNLMADPIVAIMHNVAFWNNVILRTLATQKALRVGEATGVARRLRVFEDDDGNITLEEPNTSEGYDPKVFYTYINGQEIRFASKDPLFTIGLSGNEFVSPGLFLELAGEPANFLREMVTRDPGFMIANLLRDAVSTWVLAGSGANPYGTFKGLVSALKSSSSFNALRSHAIVGSFDEAQKPMAKLVEGMRGKLTKVQGLQNLNAVLKSGWNRLGAWSEASDAATRIAVYEAAKRDGATDFTAAYRALSIMNFSRSGQSSALRTLTRLIPFLNARIQGFDVLYTGLKSAAGVLTGREQLDFERQRGTHVLVRGMGLMAAAMALSLWNEDDEDYKQLPQYIKDANILIPIPGTTGKYFQIPKPFEAGFLFMTVPETFYRVSTGDRSMRSATKLMFNQFSSTFGFNPIPQVALPIFENMINYDFYTGQPLVSPGLEKLDPSLQYNASTSYVARGLSKLSGYLPLNYDFEEGRFVPISPVKMDNLITGYGGPLISYLAMGVGGISYAFGADNQGLPVAASQLPVIRRFFVDARDKQPQAAAEAYELYQLVDRVTRTVSRLKKSGDTEALKEYREENINILRVGKQVRNMAENLNNIRAQMRRLEADKNMNREQKLEKLRELRAREARVTRRIEEINRQLGR